MLPLIVTDGSDPVLIASVDVKVRVISSPTIATVLSSLSDTILTDAPVPVVKLGAVLSNVTPEPSASAIIAAT